MATFGGLNPAVIWDMAYQDFRVLAHHIDNMPRPAATE